VHELDISVDNFDNWTTYFRYVENGDNLTLTLDTFAADNQSLFHLLDSQWHWGTSNPPEDLSNFILEGRAQSVDSAEYS
jgi:hypothetical protein